MALLDPFYGVFRPGWSLAQWLNRIVLLNEVLFYLGFLFICFSDPDVPRWIILVSFPVMLIIMNIVNLILRKIWNIVEVIVYGTTDPDVILECRQRRLKARKQRRARRQARAEARQTYVQHFDL